MIKVENLSFKYENKNILEDINLEINAGEVISIVGPNGSGKSTLLKILSRNLKHYTGEVFLNNQSIYNYKPRELAKVIAFLPQVLKVVPQFTVEELISFGRYPFLRWNNQLTKIDKTKIEEALELLELKNFRKRFLVNLSGGERQRARIAMIFAQDTEIILLDEPNTFLDISHQYKIMEILINHNKNKGKTIAMVLHDLNQAIRFSDKVIVLNNKNVYAEGKPLEVLNPETLKNVFQVESIIEKINQKYPTIVPISSSK